MQEPYSSRARKNLPSPPSPARLPSAAFQRVGFMVPIYYCMSMIYTTLTRSECYMEDRKRLENVVVDS